MKRLLFIAAIVVAGYLSSCKKENGYDCYVYTFGMSVNGVTYPPETYCGPEGDQHIFTDDNGNVLNVIHVEKK